MAEKLISKEWSKEVKIFLEASPEDVPANRGSVRLSKALMSAKTEAYAPQMVSLGPYHHFSLKDESVGLFHKRLTHLSQMEVYKLRSTREAARNDPEVIKKMFARVCQSDMISQFKQFYDWEIEEEEDIHNFGWMMMVDALFLSHFLKYGIDDGSAASKDVVLPAKASIRCDIVKLENQIPLSLLTTLEEIAKEPNPLGSLLPSLARRISSFQISDSEKKDVNEKHLLGCIHKYVSSFLPSLTRRLSSLQTSDIEKKDVQISDIEKKDVSGKQDLKEKHLLGCIHKHVASFVQVSSVDEERPTWRQRIANVMGNMVAGVFSCCYTHPAKSGRPDFLVKYSAKELVKAGIKFKSFKDQGKIRFCRNSDTLYLPQITIIDTYTEVLLRNLLALEFNDPGREKHVSNYVELMDCLIDTHEDVALLRESHVIDRQSMMITDEYVAKMWDGMSKPFFLAGFLELPGGLKAQIKEVLIKNYYKSKIKTQLSELYSQHLSSPWKVVALLVGLFVLLLTVLQTYCSVHNCEIERHPKANARKHFRPFG